MKALKLSTIGAFLLILLSCTKDVTRESQSKDQVVTSSVQSAHSTHEVDPKKPVLTGSAVVTQDDDAIIDEGDMVIVSFTATNRINNTQVACGKITIYQNINGVWTAVKTGAAPTVSLPAFKADETDLCAYNFRASFDPGGGNINGVDVVNCNGRGGATYVGVDYTEETQEDFCVFVKPAKVCPKTPFEIKWDVDAEEVRTGVFEFTVTYTLNSLVDLTGVKFQGGATAGGNINHLVTAFGAAGADEADMFKVLHENNNNTVLVWNGELKACTPKVLMFKYTRNFSCPVSGALVTGDWKASQGELVLGEVDKLPYSCDENDNEIEQ
jgi:hypothetical protein